MGCLAYLIAFFSSGVLFMTHVQPLLDHKEINTFLSRTKEIYPYWTSTQKVATFYLLLSCQIILGNIITAGLTIYHKEILLFSDATTGTSTSKASPTPVRRNSRGPIGLPILDNEHTEQNVSLYAFGLGSVAGFGYAIGKTQCGFRGFGFFLVYLSLFHTLEYISTAMYKKNVSLTCK